MATPRSSSAEAALSCALALLSVFVSLNASAQQADAGTGAGTAVIPPALTTPSPAAYPESLRGEGVEGSVKLEILIDEKGAVAEVKVAESAHPLFEAAALDAARRLTFTPATVGGVPAPVRIHYVYEFTVPKPVKAAVEEDRAVFTGQVRAMATRRPIPGATVRFDNGHPPIEADPEGRFRVELRSGSFRAIVSASGHKDSEYLERIARGQTLEVIYVLEPDRVNPYETIVRAERERTEVTRVTLRDQEIREVAGTMGDPFRVVMLMPGVGSMASGVSYPVVRGSQPASTGYFIDGVRVPSLFHLMLGPAVVHPDFIDSIDFYPGVSPVKYGRLLGGAIEGHISRPREDRLHATAYLDFINAGGFVEYPFKESKTNVTLAGRVSYTGWLAALAADAFIEGDEKPIADFYDYQARVDQKVGRTQLRLFAFGSSDVVGVTTDEKNEDTAVGHTYTIFHRIDMRARHPMGGADGELEAGLTYGQEKLGIAGERGGESLGDFGLKQQNLAGRLGYTRALGKQLRLDLGGDVSHHRARNTLSVGSSRSASTGEGVSAALQLPESRGTFAGLYAELAWKATDKWLLVPGVRADHYYLEPGIHHTSADPRLAVRYNLRENLVLKGGAGLVHQAPTVLLSLPAMDLAAVRYGLQEGAQFDIGAEWKVFDGLEINTDIYYNPLLRAVEFDLNEVLNDTRRRGFNPKSPGGPGRAYGFELMVRHPMGRSWFGWISYSFQRSSRFQRFSRFDDQNGVLSAEEGWVPFAFEQQHVFNGALSYKFGRNWTVGTVLHFNTGRPESGEISSRSRHEGVNALTGQELWVWDDRDRVERLPAFFRVDARISKSWAYKNFALDWYFDVLNISLQQEVLGHDYYNDSNGGLTRNPIRIPVVIPMMGVKGTY